MKQLEFLEVDSSGFEAEHIVHPNSEGIWKVAVDVFRYGAFQPSEIMTIECAFGKLKQEVKKAVLAHHSRVYGIKIVVLIGRNKK